jgi:hypothetical protein
MKREKKLSRSFALSVALLGSLVAAGCAGNRTLATEKVAGAEKSVDQANKSGASSDAAVELKTAADQLAEAKAAMENKDYDKAIRLSESAAADADLAQAKASDAKSKRAAAKMRETVDALKQELNRRPTN